MQSGNSSDWRNRRFSRDLKVDVNGKKRPGSPGDPIPPSPKRSNSVSERLLAADLVVERIPQLPRTSTPLDLNPFDLRAPRTPTSPPPVLDESEEEDLFYQPLSDDDQEPRPPNNSDADQIGDLSHLLSSAFQPEFEVSVVQPPNMAKAEKVPPAEVASRMSIQNSMEEAEVFILGRRHGAADREGAADEEVLPDSSLV